MNDPEIFIEHGKSPTRNDLLWNNQSKKVVYVTSDYVVSPKDDIIICNAACIVTLPISARGREIYVNKNYVGGSPVQVIGVGTDIITGGVSTTVSIDFTTKHFKAIPGAYILL